MPERSERAQLAYDTILRRPTEGIPSWLLNPMDHDHIERIAGAEAGAYRASPVETYLAFQRSAGTCMLDQYIPENPLSMGPKGYQGAARGATTGATEIVCDGIVIDSPEAAVHHMESHLFPALRHAAETFDEKAHTRAVVEHERALQETLGPDILKGPYGHVSFPWMDYGRYGYENYFMAWGLYPEVLERGFSLMADLALRSNRASARAFAEGDLPPFCRIDHDMADSRGTLVRVESLDDIWFPHFERCLRPLLDAGIRMIWHCDGNLMEMVPRLLEVGLQGFQGFQYEDGMDYERICRMRTRDGETLLIIAGVSVTRTLPFGTAEDVRRELEWLVEYGPPTGLFLAASSSIAPGVPWENMRTLVEGLRYYQTRGASRRGERS
jgi:hypothetical protein